MKRVNLTKYGFIRAAEEDFSDDGSRFTCYKVGRVRVSKTTYNGEIFIAGRIDGNLSYNEYSKLAHYKAMDALNGVDLEDLTEDDLIKFFNDCVEYAKEYSDLEANMVYPSEDEVKKLATKIRDLRKAELDYLNQHLTVEVLFRLSEYGLKNVKSYYTSIKARYEAAERTINEVNIMAEGQRKAYCESNNWEAKPSWYFTEIKNICKI